MKKIKLTFLALLAIVSASSSTFSYAKHNCPPFVVHCAYVSGLSDGLQDGRYIKLSNDKVGNIVVCFNGTSTVFMDQQGASRFVGKNIDAYSICTDAQGNHCKLVGIDNFTVSSTDKGFKAEPKYYEINVAQYKDGFPACDSLVKSHSK